MRQKPFIIVRGGGDLATGTIHRLWAAGFPVLVLETEHPAAIRRQVAVCEAVYEGSATVEGMEAVLIKDTAEAKKVIDTGKVPLIVDPDGASITALKPDVVVDAILAKKNLGTNRSMAPLTVGLGPGFTAGVDVDIVIETMRGHNLGRIIREGSAIPNTGIPGNIGGYTAERVIHAGAEGILYNVHKIGDIVEQGEEIAYIADEKENRRYSVTATIPGIIRGLIRDGYPATKGFKIADIDPRKVSCQIVSPFRIKHAVLRAVCLRLSAHLAVIFYHKNRKGIRFMKLIKTEDAVGQVLCHDITQIIKGVTKRCGFPQGGTISRRKISGTSECRKKIIFTSGKKMTRFFMKMKQRRSFMRCVKTTICIRQMLRGKN